MVRLLIIPNDPISAYFRTTPEDFLSEINPQMLFDRVCFLNWKEEKDDEFAGVRSVAFLKDKSQANSLLRRLIKGEELFSSSMFRDLFLTERETIENFLRSFKPDIIRTLNTHFAAELGVIAREISSTPLVISAHDPSRLTEAIREADSLVCESYEQRGLCIERYNVDPEKIKVIHNGIDMQVFFPQSESRVREVIPARYLNAPYKILSISRLVRGKNIETLLKALALIKTEALGLIHLHLGDGDPEKIAKLEKLRQDLKLEDTTYFLGTRPKKETPAYYSWADVFVLPSLWEGLSRVMREALSCGTPAVVTNYGSSTEIVQDNYNGILIDPTDPESIADGLVRILKDSDLRSRLKSNTRSSMKKYDVESSMQMHADNYRELLRLKNVKP